YYCSVFTYFITVLFLVGQRLYLRLGGAPTANGIHIDDSVIGVSLAVIFHVSGLGKGYDDSVYCYAPKTNARANNVCKAFYTNLGFVPNFNSTQSRYTIGKW
ncbi:MAG: hypothetical protein MJ053_02150, partial [Elusimicrobiaceae bacterium]|nr:hypothetical protein [Elusimicrobiaceae bacterium]